MRSWIWITHIFCTFFVTGLIWLVQIVNYPLFAYVGDGWRDYHDYHLHAITLVVMLPMIVELITAGLLIRYPQPLTTRRGAIFGLSLVILIWIVTMGMSVPAHNGLDPVFDADQHAKLLQSNTIRTGLWSVRSIWLIWLIHRVSRRYLSAE